jgi:predicted Zn-dependent peptidase
VLPAQALVTGLTLDDVQRFHARRYVPGGARLYVSGRFDSAAMRRAIETAFGDWRADAPPPVSSARAAPGPRVVLIDRPGATQSTVRLAFPAPAMGAADDVPFRAANALLAGSANARINRNIRGRRGYAYSVRSGVGYRDPHEATWVFSADVGAAVTGPALSEVFSEIRQLQVSPPTEAEVAVARNVLVGSFVLQTSTAAGVTDAVAQRDAYRLPESWLTGYVPQVTALTAEQIRQAAASTLPLESLTLVVVGDLATIRPQLEALPELAGVAMVVSPSAPESR